MRRGKRPISSATACASSRLLASPERGHSSPAWVMVSLKSWRSSASCMARSEAPISSTPKRASTPLSARATARLSPVCPPTVGSRASGRSWAMICSTHDRQWLHIGGVGQVRVGHDGGRVAVHQDDAIPLSAQSLHRLRPAIIEFACLANDDGPGAKNQNGMDVSTFGH